MDIWNIHIIASLLSLYITSFALHRTESFREGHFDFETMFQQASVPMAVLSPDAQFLLCNEIFQSYTGLSM